MRFATYTKQDYQAVIDFLVALNQDQKDHINWNWARFEWMMAHPEFHSEYENLIGLWWNQDKVVAAAIFDMYPGEASCLVLPAYQHLFAEVLDYAERTLGDEEGLAIAFNENDEEGIAEAARRGYISTGNKETVMSVCLDDLPETNSPFIRLEPFDPGDDPEGFFWLMWQGFDHGSDYQEFKENTRKPLQKAPHFKKSLSISALNESGERVAYCCLWHDSRTDYVYVEPVCVIPSYRGKGVGKAVVLEALLRARKEGAKTAYVISDMAFYQKLGFAETAHYRFCKLTKERA